MKNMFMAEGTGMIFDLADDIIAIATAVVCVLAVTHVQ